MLKSRSTTRKVSHSWATRRTPTKSATCFGEWRDCSAPSTRGRCVALLDAAGEQEENAASSLGFSPVARTNVFATRRILADDRGSRYFPPLVRSTSDEIGIHERPQLHVLSRVSLKQVVSCSMPIGCPSQGAFQACRLASHEGETRPPPVGGDASQGIASGAMRRRSVVDRLS